VIRDTGGFFKLLHPGNVETRRIENDTYRIAGSHAGSEDIDLG
jgi:hypothetical protein